MLDRLVAGEVPAKHHIVARHDGALLHEECITRAGFDGPYSLVYHLNRPQTHMPIQSGYGFGEAPTLSDVGLRKRHIKTGEIEYKKLSALNERVPIVYNAELTTRTLQPGCDDEAYFSNGDGDELFYIFEGGGVLRSPFGDLRFEKDDYVAVPKGVIHRFIPDSDKKQFWLNLEGQDFGLLRQWRTETGQLRMDAPYCHRDFRSPDFVGPQDEGIRQMVMKRGNKFHSFVYEHSPLDAVGFDGSVYPWVFPILNFQPRAGLVHLPPDWHGTFRFKGALVCSFVPRVVDFHPEAIPCPYPHSSVDCDEILFYCRGNFTSRRGVGPASVTLHPAGIAHGPHPGAYEASIGSQRTDELAVMVDTFLPLNVAERAVGAEDVDYQTTFV